MQRFTNLNNELMKYSLAHDQRITCDNNEWIKMYVWFFKNISWTQPRVAVFSIHRKYKHGALGASMI